MAGKRQPTELLVQKGRKHFTKAELELRKAQELHPKADKVKAPAYLDAARKKRFNELAAELIQLEIMTNLDCEALARVIVAEQQYIEVTQQIDQEPLMMEVVVQEADEEAGTERKTRLVPNDNRLALMIVQDRCWKQCRQGAADFGLAISPRCRLVVARKDAPPPENKFAKFGKTPADRKSASD